MKVTFYQLKPIRSAGNEKKKKKLEIFGCLWYYLRLGLTFQKISWYFMMELKQEARHIDADVVGIAPCHFKQEDISYSFLCVFVYKGSF